MSQVHHLEQSAFNATVDSASMSDGTQMLNEASRRSSNLLNSLCRKVTTPEVNTRSFFTNTVTMNQNVHQHLIGLMNEIKEQLPQGESTATWGWDFAVWDDGVGPVLQTAVSAVPAVSALGESLEGLTCPQTVKRLSTHRVGWN